MTWLDKNYKKRQIIGVDIFGGTASSPKDINIDIPKDWDLFWDNIKANAFDIKIANYKGEKVTFQRANLDVANRVLQIQCQAVIFNDNDSMNVLYVYWDYPDESTDPTTGVSFTPTSPLTGYIELSKPHSRMVMARGYKNITEQPIEQFVKGTDEEIHVFFQIQNLFAKRVTRYNGYDDFEGLEWVKVESLDGGVHSDTRIIEAQTRILNGYVRATFKGGDDGTTYVIRIKYQTSFQQILETRALLKVQNQTA